MKRICLILTMLIAMGATVGAKVVKRYSTSSSPVLTIMVDSIDFRKDLTRVYGKLSGHPHTSQRIDRAALLTGKSTHEATDIDGVDFKRYFQWEEDGIIPVEIDFPSMKVFKSGRLVLDTPHGESLTPLNRR